MLRWRRLIGASWGDMTMSDTQTLAIQMPQELIQYWGWFLAFGIALVAIGVAAVARAFTATIASMLFFGWLLVIAAAIEIVQAVIVGHWAGFFHHLLAAILFGVTGLLLVTRPLISAEALIKGRVTSSRPVTPKRIAASKWWKKPAQCPTMTAWTISIAAAITNSQPKNNIEAMVAVKARATAATPIATNAIPNARNHPQYWMSS